MLVPLPEGRKIAKRALPPHYSSQGMQSPGGAVRYDDCKLLECCENGTVQPWWSRTPVLPATNNSSSSCANLRR